MEFYLIYEGPLKANAGPREKQKIREYFQPQLENLWNTFPLIENKDLLSSSDPQKICILKEISDITFAPLVTTAIDLICELDITMLDPSDSLVKTGDIDNRLKTLFDALTCPDANQIKSIDSFNKQDTYYALLEDDKLITSFAIKTNKLLQKPINDGIFVLIKVHVKPYRLTWNNIGL